MNDFPVCVQIIKTWVKKRNSERWWFVNAYRIVDAATLEDKIQPWSDTKQAALDLCYSMKYTVVIPGDACWSYDLITYDVLGDEDDGYWVNATDVSRRGIVLSDRQLATDKSLMSALRDLGVVKIGLHTSSVAISGERSDTLYFVDVRQRSGRRYPMCELRCTGFRKF